jgi:UDPglucose--hexose-1-phosphate uridylyltransferase
MADQLEGKWEKRWHPLREEWVVYSAHRNTRPWQGAGIIQPKNSPEYDPGCYLCPGNQRVGGIQNPKYTDVFIFENDHPVVGMNSPVVTSSGASGDLYRKARAAGKAKVVCYDPRHNVTLSEMKINKVFGVFKAFRKETSELFSEPSIKSVLIFENKGEAVGVSNPHPHCQIYATDFTFKFIQQQIEASEKYKKEFNRDLFNDIIESERKDGARIIAQNDHAIAFIPFFARYAYEVMIFPKKNHSTLMSLSDDELFGLASVFHQVVRKLDMNYNMSFPYVMNIMQAPADEREGSSFRMHMWIQPPYRQPGLIKYLAGPEIGGGNFMADTMPEEKAAELNKIDVSKYSNEQ